MSDERRAGERWVEGPDHRGLYTVMRRAATPSVVTGRYECGVAEYLSKADADAYLAADARIARLETTLKAAAEVIGDGFHRSGGTDQTSWDECGECGHADWQEHKPGCRIAELIQTIRAALADAGEPGGV